MIRKESKTWEEDTAHAAKVGAVVLALLLTALAIWQPLDHSRDDQKEQAEVRR